MKKTLMLAIALLALVLPWACSDNNSSPSKPTASPAGGGAAPPTNTPIAGPPGTPTFTPTPAIVAPPYIGEWPTASAPNGFYLAAGNNLYVAEGDGILPYMQVFTTTTGVITNHWNFEVVSITGSSVTVLLNNPIGVVYTPLNIGGTFFSILDGTANGGASIYTGTGVPSVTTNQNTGTSWGTQPFKAPKGFATDGNYIYVADTGNGYVEEFDPYSGPAVGTVHRWRGYSPTNFSKPAAVAIDPTNDIWVADNGYNPPLISEFASGGVTWLDQFQTVPNCVVNGMAVTTRLGVDVVYISDLANQQVEEYDFNGNLLRLWGNPHGTHQFQPFAPSCIAIDTANNHIIVGDQNNDTIEVFGP